MVVRQSRTGQAGPTIGKRHDLHYHGLTNGGVTTHFNFQYDDSLGGSGGIEPARTNAVIAACEGDYNLMSGWFGGGVNVTGMTVQVTTGSNGASWSGSATSSTVQLKPNGLGFDNSSDMLRYLMVAEITEIFMMAQGIGWFQGGDEGSKGEGLSRFLSCQFLVTVCWAPAPRRRSRSPICG
jgi:hypothetical protein